MNEEVRLEDTTERNEMILLNEVKEGGWEVSRVT